MASEFPASLVTPNAEEGLQLAIRLARLGVKAVQPDMDILRRLRPKYSEDAHELIASSHVMAVHFQTIARVNDYWRDQEGSCDK